MAIACGYEGILSVSNNDITFNIMSGVTSVSFDCGVELIDVTEMGDDASDKIYGLLDSGFTISGDYDPSDTAQASLETEFEDRDDVYIQIRWDGTSGHKVRCSIESFDISSEVGGKVTFSCSLVGQAAPSTSLTTEA